MKILSKNSKTGYSVNFPIEDTCDRSCPLYKDRTCYGLKGRFTFGVVKAANDERLKLYRENPHMYFWKLKDEIITKKIKFLRVNGVGDTPNETWALRFIVMAESLPDVRFWVSTRKKNIWGRFYIPANVLIRYSDGIEGDATSEVVNENATCPATIKGSGVHTCSEKCGYMCWSKEVKHVRYLKH